MDLFLPMIAIVFISASIFLKLGDILNRLEKISERIDKESTSKPTCESCKWRDDFTGVCCNDKSPYVTDYKDDDESCDVMRRSNNG